VNLLGEKYVDLDPGDLSKPMPEGSTIPKTHTSVPVELDDAINILDPDTRGALRILINEAGIAMAGRGTDFNKTLDELPRALDSAERLVSEIDKENVALERAIVSGDRVVTAVGAKSDDMGELVESAADALSTVADRRARLGETVRDAPAGLNQLRTTLEQLQGASEELTPTARDLRATAPSLADTLARAPQFAKDAKATLRTAARVAPNLSKLGRQSTPTIKLLRPTSERLATFAGEFQPLVNTLDKDKGLIDFLGFMDGWAGVTDGADGLGHHFRLRATIDGDLLGSALSRFNPLATKKKSSQRKAAAPKRRVLPEAPATTAPQTGKPKLLPDLPTKPVTDALQKGLEDVGNTVEDAVGGLLGGLTGRTRDGSGSSTNDTTKLFNYLLGP
jgi:ABC-type transporter Mla subunit MlaD